ncbi:MAG: ADP-forming succinate--CoA ligase subunit beta [Gammaproteobacteria bacterium]|nr:ADP-forming succinate--CoA ligase subunit beta [Gammaproteobacteria bacterium]
MNIHEYQAKRVLARFDVRVPNGQPAFTPPEARAAAQALGGGFWVVKSQIHAGGRGAGHFANDPNGDGGVRLARSLQEVEEHAKAMLGQVLVTKQTGPEGREVKRLYIEEGCDIEKELYLGMLLDRGSSQLTIMASTEGGMDIETVAHDTPEKILRVKIDPITGLQGHHTRRIAFALGLSGRQISEAGKFISNMYRAFVELDATVIEMNPLVVLTDGSIMALDAKMNFDDNALYRQPDIQALRDTDEEDPLEVIASQHNLNYVNLDGNIGCMVNGAGLAMATMDIIKLYGAEPANFLDVGGDADQERVTAAFKLILTDPNVKGILINIFGGIMRCDVIAEGVVAAAKEISLKLPLVVRLEGTNVELGKKVLEDSGLHIVTGEDLGDAARKIVDAIKEAN